MWPVPIPGAIAMNQNKNFSVRQKMSKFPHIE